jgi:hypothetical protein
MARKEKTIHYLYKTTCLITNRYYIGMHSTSNLEDGYMGSGLRLRRSIRKYGVENHTKEILEFFENRVLLIEAEKKAITPEMLTDKNCINLMSGGEGGFISEEQQKHRSSCAGKAFVEKLNNDFEFRTKYKESHSKGLKNAYANGVREKKYFYDWNNKQHTEETKNKISEIKKAQTKGENNSQFGTCWITKDGVNKKIKKEGLEIYLLEGWVKGRKIKNSIQQSNLR